MTEYTINSPNKPDQASITVSGQLMHITITDGEKMRNALIAHYSQSCGKEKQYAERLKSSSSWIDHDGVLRIGLWLLEDHFGRLALVKRNRAGDFFHLDVAYMKQGSDGEWIVETLEQEHIPLRNN